MSPKKSKTVLDDWGSNPANHHSVRQQRIAGEKKIGRGEGNLSLLVLPLFCFWGPYMFYWLIVVDYGWLEGIW